MENFHLWHILLDDIIFVKWDHFLAFPCVALYSILYKKKERGEIALKIVIKIPCTPPVEVLARPFGCLWTYKNLIRILPCGFVFHPQGTTSSLAVVEQRKTSTAEGSGKAWSRKNCWLCLQHFHETRLVLLCGLLAVIITEVTAITIPSNILWSYKKTKTKEKYLHELPWIQ